ncbi:MAG: glycosyltransferase [Chlorobia bacterium]|nr:glycosyltransferase [Fimbriimonadaceae bacterium]
MTRILHVIRSCDPASGGPIEGIRQRAKALQEMGHEVEVVSLDEADPIRDPDLIVHALGPGKGSYGYSRRLVPWLLEKGASYDFVIANGIWQYTSFATRKAMQKLNKPYFVFTHGMLDPWFKTAYPLKHLKKAIYWPWGEYRVLRDAAAVLFTCEEERVLARKSFKLYRSNERVVSYGTSGPVGDPGSQVEAFLERHSELKGKRIILFLSRIHPKKGCDNLLEAFALVCSSEPSLHLVIAGPDQLGLRSELEGLADTLGIKNRITWTGMLSGDMKWGAYHASECFILPSHQENFGIVVAEALACGKPVLVSNKVNIWREIESDISGLVAEDTKDATADMLTKWNELSVAEKGKMAKSARSCFENRFEIAASAQSLLQVLGEVGQ